jgi:hypothetical protein
LGLFVLLSTLVDKCASGQSNWNGAFGLAAVEDLTEEVGNDLDDTVIDHKDVIIGEKSALLLERLELLLQLLDTEYAADPFAEGGRECVRSDEVLVCSLWVLGEDANLGIARNDRVGQDTVWLSEHILAHSNRAN